jgi:hypothetical protein
MADDKLQREIEDILNRLDAFVPEERAPSRMRRRSSDAASAFGRAVLAPLAGISLRQVMLTALALTLISLLLMNAQPTFAKWVLIAGLILFFTTIALSIFNRGAASSGPKVTKYWRDRPIDLDEPGPGERFRSWWQGRFGRRR